jgi:hypothetical protein
MKMLQQVLFSDIIARDCARDMPFQLQSEEWFPSPDSVTFIAIKQYIKYIQIALS